MRPVIVSVQWAGGGPARDLEVPADLAAAELAELLARSLGPAGGADGGPGDWRIEAIPPGRLLEPDECLAAAGAWDGAWLVLHPTGAGG